MRTNELLDLIDETLADSLSPDAVRYSPIGQFPAADHPEAVAAREVPSLDVLQIASDWVTTGVRHGSPSMITRRLSQEHRTYVGPDTARRLLDELHLVGIVGPIDPKAHDYPVLLAQDEATEALRLYRADGRGSLWSVVYECPICWRVAPWTDGRSTAAGDERDEFWCQACGTESPLHSRTAANH